ncbi:TonB-dependent receptor [Pararcticibacter amylolyticus]|uniref:TonB-dependent receptor n=1 Tax=Pararcticibacter amylolyticus TaxID=2173175 RepID=A0A2U2PJD7_9SPHI|nr:TonB-dependent receptor [Pararcticibacter amylolyticus]PWG81517.1 TonB-dependent receptor [Pararcticibacter amylolyticus]
MKITGVLLFAFCIQVSASVYSQQASINVSNSSLENVFVQLRKQTGYRFLYKNENVSNKKVSISTSGELADVLRTLFAGQGLSFIIQEKTILVKKAETALPPELFSADIPVKGKVTDEKGEPLPGASVRVKGTSSGATTDANGVFRLAGVPESSILVITYTGFIQQEIPLKGREDLTVILKENATELNQVVVVGYGTQRKASVTGSVAQISGKELGTAPTSNLSSMLQGRLPGLVTRQTSGQPGSDGASLLVRGISTTANSSPLIIVDGFERDFPSINPEEVESVTVLKDASAIAVYGVRGANGVVLVTTKRGSVQKNTINVNSALSLSSNTNFPAFLDGPGYAYWYNKAQEMDGIAESARRFTTDEISRIGNGDQQGVFANTDWFGMLFKDYAPVYTNNLSLSGGTDKYKFFISLGAYNQEGIIDRTSYDRYNVRANLDADINKNLSASVSLALIDGKAKEPGLSAGIGNDYASIFSQAMMSYPYLSPYNASGMPVGSLNAGNGNQNPIAARDLSGENNTRNSRFQGNVALTYKVPAVKGLSLKMNAAYDKGYSMRKAFLLPYLLSVYNNSTRNFTEAYARHAQSGDAQVNQWFTNSWRTTLQPSVTYDRVFDKHAIGALFLYEYMRNDDESLSGGRRGYPITDIMDLNFGEEVIDNLVKGGHGMYRRAGYVTRFNYSYANKYLLEFSGRYDGTPKLPEETRWGFFPAVSAGWRISEEGFFKNALPFVNDLKIRASAGILGNDRIPDYQYLRTVSLGTSPVVLIGDKLSRPLNVTQFPNLGIKWETTRVYNIGLESSMWNGLLGIEADGFYKVTKDILQGQSGEMPASLGQYYASTVNSGMVDGRGVELILKHNNRIGQFDYFFKGNFSWAKNKIIKVTENANVPDYMRRTGKPAGVKFGFLADGLFQSQEEIDNAALFGPTRVGEVRLKDLNGDGKITFDQDWTVIGRSDMPEMMFGLNAGGNFHGFDFNLFFQGAARNDVALSGLYSDKGIYDNTFYTMAFYQDGNSPRYLAENAWTPENPNTEYPRLSTTAAQSGGKFSSWWVRDGAYLRLKSAQIGYTLSKKLSSRLNIQNIRLHVAGSNLFTITGLDYLDPEMPSVNQGYYPQQKLYEFGINVTL